MTGSPSGKSKWVVALLKAACTAAVLGLLLWKYDLHDVFARLQRLTPSLVVGLCAYYAGCQLLASLRWSLILKAKGMVVPLRRLFRFFLIGQFFNTFLPTGLGGDAVKALYLYKETKEGEESLVSVFLDRFVGLIGMGLISLAALPFGGKVFSSELAMGAVCGSAAFLALIVLLVWLLPRSPWLVRMTDAVLPHVVSLRVRRLASALDGYRHYPFTLLGATALSVLLQLLYCYYFVWVAQGLGTPIPALYFMLFLPAINLAAMAPVSLGGLGVREWAMVALFHELGFRGAEVLAISLTVYLLSVLFSLPSGLLLFLGGNTARRSKEKSVTPIGADHSAAVAQDTAEESQEKSSCLFGRLGRMASFPFRLDRSRYLVGGAALVLMVAAFFPWSQAPSASHSFVDGSGQLVLLVDANWTEYLVRIIAYAGGIVFFGLSFGVFTAGPRMTALGWTVAACLIAFAPWTAEFAPDQFSEKTILFREMNRVIDDVEKNVSEQRTDWRSGQSIAHETIMAHSAALSPERQPWTVSLFAPHRWWEAFEDVLGYTHEFFAFFRPKLLAALIVSTTLLLIGLHLADGRGLRGLPRSAAWGGACTLFLLACALVPRSFGEFLLGRAEEDWQRGDQALSVDHLRAAADWRPDLSRIWWYYARVGRSTRLQGNPTLLEARLADAYDYVMANQLEQGLDELRRAQALDPEDPILRRCLGCGLAEAGIGVFNNGQYSLARQDWEELISLTPTNPTPWYGLSLFYLRVRDFESCARCLDQLVRLEGFFGYQRLTLRSQDFVARSWAAAQSGDLGLAHKMYCQSLRPDNW